MAVIRDMMPVFELFQPASIDEALNLLDEHKADVWVLGGGMDSFDWLKDRTKRVSTVVDLSQLSDLRGIKEVDGGLEIGAMTTLTTVVNHPVAASWIKNAVQRGARLILADPRATPMARFAQWHLAFRPDTDVALLTGMLHVIVAEGLVDDARWPGCSVCSRGRSGVGSGSPPTVTELSLP